MRTIEKFFANHKIREYYSEKNIFDNLFMLILHQQYFEYSMISISIDEFKEQCRACWSGIEAKILELRNLNKSFRDIGRELNINHMKVKRILVKYETSL